MSASLATENSMVPSFAPPWRKLRAVPVRSIGSPEAQALKLVAKSETTQADAILDEVIRVFVAVTRGIDNRAPAIDERSFALFQSMLAPILQALTTVTRTISDLTGVTITDLDSKQLRRDVQEIARLRTQGNKASKGENSERRIIYNKLGAAVAWTGTGRSWRTLPATKVADARAALREMKADAMRCFPSSADRQLSLLSGGKT